MTKSDLIEKVAAQLNLPKGKAELIINCIFDSMEEALKQGQRIEIRGFGSFEIRKYKAYEGRNPRTGDPVGVHPKRLPFFKVGKELKERVNAGAVTIRVVAPKESSKDKDRDAAPTTKDTVKESAVSKDGKAAATKAPSATAASKAAPAPAPAAAPTTAASAAAPATKKKSSSKPKT